ncbi:uncharacterized protein LOC116615275 [Nematostella vectensis]|uniref:uncharacterized protein LOC116615275 n=1 Tax=Nematostella vectensis TaxID=45351 RepID=UPI002076DEEB|nr:uncharacterized protein LOC116615275 [Nematostella vectensis]
MTAFFNSWKIEQIRTEIDSLYKSSFGQYQSTTFNAKSQDGNYTRLTFKINFSPGTTHPATELKTHFGKETPGEIIANQSFARNSISVSGFVAPPLRTLLFTVTIRDEPWKSNYSSERTQRAVLKNKLYKTNDDSSWIKKLTNILGNIKSFYDMRAPTDPEFSDDGGFVRASFEARFTKAIPGDVFDKEPDLYLRDGVEQGKLQLDHIVSIETAPGHNLSEWMNIVGQCKTTFDDTIVQNRSCVLDNNTLLMVETQREIPCKYGCSKLNCTVRLLTFKITLANEPWKSTYRNISYPETKGLMDELLEEVRKLLTSSSLPFLRATKTPWFTDVDGKTRAKFRAYFSLEPNKEDPESFFRFHTENKRLGKFTIDPKTVEITEFTTGHTLQKWTHSDNSCKTCCGGPLIQTRGCSIAPSWTNDTCSGRLVTRSIKCNYVCSKVYCEDKNASPGIVPPSLTLILITMTLYTL